MRYKTIISALLPILFFCCPASSSFAQSIGIPDWAKRISEWAKLGTIGGAGVWDMATDKHGNVYVLSQHYGKVNIDGHIAAPDSNAMRSLVSWDCNGVFRWMKVFCGAAAPDYLEVDTSDGVYIAGVYTYSTSVGDTAFYDTDTLLAHDRGICIAKYNSNGVMQWFKTPVSEEAGTPIGYMYDFSVSPNGDFYWYAYLPSGTYDYGAFSVTWGGRYCAVKYNASGIFQSNTLLDISSTKSTSTQSGIHFTRHERSGRFYAYGAYRQSVFGILTIGNTTMSTTTAAQMAYAAAFKPSGANLWVKTADTGKSSGIQAGAIDGDGNLFFAGYGLEGGVVLNGDTVVNDPSFSNPYYSLPFAGATDSAGNRLWFSNAKGDDPYLGFNSLEYYNGFVAIAGSYRTAFIWDSVSIPRPTLGTGDNIFICKLSAATGKLVAIDSIKENAHRPVLSADRNGNLFVGGLFLNQLKFGATTLLKIDTTTSAGSGFVGKYKNVNCNCDLLLPEFTATATSVNSVNFSYTGQMPYTSITWDLGDGATLASNPSPSHTYTASGYYPVCVTVVNGCGSNTICHWVTINLPNAVTDAALSNAVKIYPNPATAVLYLDNVPPETIAELYNVQGQKLLRKNLKKGQDEVNIHRLPSGVYLLRLTDKNGKQTMERIVKE